MTSHLVFKEAHSYLLSGEISIHHITKLADDALKMFEESSPKILDLRELKKADSALLALLIAWKSQYKTQLEIQNIPYFFQELMKIYQINL